MKVGFTQFTPDFDVIDENIEKIRRLVEKIDVELIILPELCCNTGYLSISRREDEKLSEGILPAAERLSFTEIW